jgi:hypothetical protein
MGGMTFLACSGPHALEVIAVSIAMGYAHARAVGVFCAISIGLAAMQKRWLPPTVLASLLLVHPAWFISAGHGDCGTLLLQASWLVTLIGIAVLCWQLIRAVGDRLPKVAPPNS